MVRSALILLTLSCALRLSALDPSRALTQYVQTVWRMEEGLPHNTVRAVVQTRDGYLWLGTYAGLVRFDGVRFVVFDTRNSKLRHNEIRSLAEDRDGVLWIGTTAGGLHRLANGVLEAWDRGIEQRTINALKVAADGTLWVGTTDGLYAMKSGRAVRYAQPQGLDTPFVNSIALGAAAVWIATTRGLFRLPLASGRAAEVATQEFAGAEVNAVHCDRAGRVWAASRDRAVALEWDAASSSPRQVRTLVLPRVRGWVNTFLDDRDGNLWIATYGAGLFRWSGGRLDHISTDEGLHDHRPWGMLEDAEGSLWLGTRSGLVRLRDGAATALSAQEGLPADITRTVMEDRDGAIWIGSEGGLSEYRAGVLRSFTAQNGLPIAPVRSVVRDREGRFWAAGDGGIVELDTRRGRVVRTVALDALPTTSVRNMLFDRAGRAWVGTERGVAVADRGLPGPLRLPAELADLASQAIEALFEDREGGIWIGSIAYGMRRWHDGKVEKPTLLADASIGVRSFHEDADGTFYVGTVGSGLFIRTPGRPFRRVTTVHGLPDDAIWAILPAGDLIWMSSDRGVFSVRRSSLLDVIEGRAASVTVERLIGTQDGMKSRECNGGGRPAGVIARDGRIWVPTSRGAVAIDPGKLSLNHLPPPVVIEEVVIDRRVIPKASVIEVAPGSRDVEVHFTGLSFVDPSRVRFRYRLAGYDPSWIDTGPRRTAYFGSLPPGTYELHVQAANNDGVWNDAGARLTLRVLPRLYETWWFRSLVVLALGTAVWIWMYLRSAAQRARETELRQMVRDRTEEIERANARLAQLAAVDDLTGIANHRHFFATLQGEWLRCQREGEPVSLLMCDVDDFKAYNDTYGHPEGDTCLRRVAEAMTGAVRRPADLVARYGGEEFAVILPSTDSEGARLAAEQIRIGVELLGIEHRGSRTGPHLTISIGSATVRPVAASAGSVTDLIAAADHALYAAKVEGRNRVVVA